MESKICFKCRNSKPVNEFGKNKRMKDGLRYYCKSCVSVMSREYYEKNTDKVKERVNKYNECKLKTPANIEHIKEYQRKKRRTPRGNLNNRMQNLIYYALKGNRISPTLKTLIGYTPREVRKHFQSLFTDGMSLNNYGKWQVDHIQPICSFNYETSNDKEFQKCWALNNLQPLWKKDNVEKGRKYIKS